MKRYPAFLYVWLAVHTLATAVTTAAGLPKFRLLPAVFAKSNDSETSHAACDATGLPLWAEDRILAFLAADSSNGDDANDSHRSVLERFHIQGWRWHTQSLVREATRLDALVRRQLTQPDAAQLGKAIDYVVGFNLDGLHRIEQNTFFPWMRTKLTGVDDPQLSEAFAAVMDQLEDRRMRVSKIGHSITKKMERLTKIASQSKASDSKSLAAARNVDDQIRIIRGIATESSALMQETTWMMQVEDKLLVPSIVRLVDSGEQKSFSNKVLMSLGILDSRLHLVGMHEAVRNKPYEYSLFEKEIPYIPRMMIPRWKRNLYDPKTDVLS